MRIHSIFISILCTVFPLCAVAQDPALPLRRQESLVSHRVEKMYAKGLGFLKGSQHSDGSWGSSNKAGITGLCIMAFLSHGECYGVVKHPKLAVTLKKATDLILAAQKRNPKGGWRYSPNDTSADSTVAGCQLVALYAASNAGIPIPKEALDIGKKYMKTCRNKNGGYGYTSGHSDKPTLTAIGSLIMALAKEKDSEDYKVTTKYLQNKINHRETHYIYYFEYYMSQALFQADSESWKKWNEKNIRFMEANQSSDGSFSRGIGGTHYATAAALLSMAKNYTFLPIYER